MKRDRSESMPRISFWTIIGLLLLLVFLLNYLDRVNNLMTARASVSAMEQEVELAQQWNGQLKAELSYYASREYVEEIARSELGYVQPGDDVLVVLSPQDETAAEPALPLGTGDESSSGGAEPSPLSVVWWQSWLQRLGIIR